MGELVVFGALELQCGLYWELVDDKEHNEIHRRREIGGNYVCLY